MSSKPVTISLTSLLSVRLYSDCRPSCLETAPLQKGLVLMVGNRELVEEGLGFGVPVVKYDDKTFFCSRAEVSQEHESEGCTLRKTFVLDTISCKKFGDASYINDNLYGWLRRVFELLYLKHKRLQPLFNTTMALRQVVQIKTDFLTVKSRGTIVVTYRCKPHSIGVEVDFSKINLGRCQELLVLNEQGSSTFQYYIDSAGLELRGRRIGAWAAVNAYEASLGSPRGMVSFKLQRVAGSELFRGWEQTRKRFSWAGLSYVIPPQKGTFRYSIRLN